MEEQRDVMMTLMQERCEALRKSYKDVMTNCQALWDLRCALTPPEVATTAPAMEENESSINTQT